MKLIYDEKSQGRVGGRIEVLSIAISSNAGIYSELEHCGGGDINVCADDLEDGLFEK